MSTATPPAAPAKKAYASGQDVRWCPACGDYSILTTVQKVLPEFGVPKENIVIVSGIGCSSRFPYYVDTYGFHTLHGRAPTVATGVKLANPDLDVWIVTGDGDALAIGGNHLIHLLRRNLRIKVLLLNNRIYGLTKGQFSPTSENGQKTKTSPFGNLETPVNPCALAIGADASFVARTSDRQPDHFAAVLRRAHAHPGTAFIEVLQNCMIFNDGCWDPVLDRERRADTTLQLEHGKPLRFGKDGTRGMRQRGFAAEAVDGASDADLLTHDERADAAYAMMLARLGENGGPVAMGVLRATPRPTYEERMLAMRRELQAKGRPTLADLYRGFGKVATWEVAAH